MVLYRNSVFLYVCTTGLDHTGKESYSGHSSPTAQEGGIHGGEIGGVWGETEPLPNDTLPCACL